MLNMKSPHVLDVAVTNMATDWKSWGPVTAIFDRGLQLNTFY